MPLIHRVKLPSIDIAFIFSRHHNSYSSVGDGVVAVYMGAGIAK